MLQLMNIYVKLVLYHTMKCYFTNSTSHFDKSNIRNSASNSLQNHRFFDILKHMQFLRLSLTLRVEGDGSSIDILRRRLSSVARTRARAMQAIFKLHAVQIE